MFCTNCGNQVSEMAVQCDHCGASLTASRRLKAENDSAAFRTTPSNVPASEQQTMANLSPSQPQVAPLTGRVLGGRYQLDAWIGGGGMGAIYKARRLHIGDTVAVKVLRPEVVNDALSRERFHREARAAAMLNHPNAVVIHDFGEDADGTAYIVMEYIEGKSLRQILNEEKTIPAERSYGIIRQACAALEAAHRRGIIHRDIKPDNIILTSTDDLTDHVKILDFGIAKLRDKATDTASLEKSLTTVGTVIGTPHYMSPEQCQGEPADARSDIYSLGVVIYEMLVGAVPFTAKTPTGVAVKHVTENPRALSEIRTGIAPAVEKLVMRALSKAPEDRQQSALELAREFDSAVQTSNSTSRAAAVETINIKPASANSDAASPGPETNIIPALNNQSAETKKVPGKPSPAENKTTPTRSFPLLPVVAGVMTLALAGSGLFWFVTRKASTPEPVPTPTPVVVTSPTAQPSATPIVAPEGMVYIESGTFNMGRDDGGSVNDRPSHRVEVKAFFIDKTEVTNEAYQKFVDSGHSPPTIWKGNRFPAGMEKHPVTGVTWEDATQYAESIGKRLPSEEEWEFAARGKDDRRLYPWGEAPMPGKASVKDTTNEKPKLMPVGSFLDGASPFGLLDLVGNAWEWTDGDFKEYPGGKVEIRKGYENSRLKVLRGGYFGSAAEEATVTIRFPWPATVSDWPEAARASATYDNAGFRCAKNVSAQ